MKLDRNQYLESRSMRPRTVFLALLAVNVILGVIVWVFPSDGISLGDDRKLKFVSFSELIDTNDSATSEVDIENILAGVSPLQEGDTLSKKTPLAADSSVESSVSKDSETTKNLARVRGLQLPRNNPNALKTLKYGLKIASKSKVVRILHYGDSQLEGDRITDYFRNKMQLTFGGKGPGILLPNEPAASSRRSAFVSESKNFKKKAIYVKGEKAKDNKYGIGGASFTISGGTSRFKEWQADKDTAGNRKATFTNTKQALAYMKVRVGSSSYALARQHNKATLLYGTDEPFMVKLRSDNYVNKYVVPAATARGKYVWNRSTQKNLELTFSKGKFPTIYGLALDGEKGVAVDNFAMRGSSAIGFSKMDQTLYGKQLKQMNVCAIMLQYGINVVPNVRSDYGYYKNILKKQLKSIKTAYPGVSIIVIGPSDMSRKRGGKMVSYSNIPLIRDAMKEAALESGCCFWDLYEAMGGENSMSAWVKEGLAQKDYTHFSYKGAQYVGEMLFNAIQDEIEKK